MIFNKLPKIKIKEKEGRKEREGGKGRKNGRGKEGRGEEKEGGREGEGRCFDSECSKRFLKLVRTT